MENLFKIREWEKMDIVQVKSYRCVICRNASIVQRMVEHTYEGEVPDQSNCDLSTYDQHVVIGGKLLAKRPHVSWKPMSLYLLEEKVSRAKFEADGGICSICLSDNAIDSLIKGGHINFATAEDLKKS